MGHNELGETKTAILIGLEGQGTHDKYDHDKYAWTEKMLLGKCFPIEYYKNWVTNSQPG